MIFLLQRTVNDSSGNDENFCVYRFSALVVCVRALESKRLNDRNIKLVTVKLFIFKLRLTCDNFRFQICC